MAQSGTSVEKQSALATHVDIRDVFGNLEDDKMMAILALKPTIGDVEEASVWLSGDPDVFGPGRPLKGAPSQIVALLTADEDEEARGGR